MALFHSPLVRAAALGVVAGMRAELPLALLLGRAERKGGRARRSLPKALRAKWVRDLSRTLTGTELVADKLPFMPSRLNPVPLVARTALGALAATLLGRRLQLWSPLAAAAGVLGTLVGARVFHDLRMTLPRRLGLPDLPVALSEDALAVSLGRWAVGA